MSLTSDQIARAVLRDTKKRGRDLVVNLPGEIRKWLHSTPWFYKEYPTQESRDDLYWRVRKRMLQRLRPKGGKQRSTKRSDKRQLSLNFGDPNGSNV